MYKNL
ncbi:hypothetical protein YPPY48_1749, partial [Yersinia pestis PY-48]